MTKIGKEEKTGSDLVDEVVVFHDTLEHVTQSAFGVGTTRVAVVKGVRISLVPRLGLALHDLRHATDERTTQLQDTGPSPGDHKGLAVRPHPPLRVMTGPGSTADKTSWFLS